MQNGQGEKKICENKGWISCDGRLIDGKIFNNYNNNLVEFVVQSGAFLRVLVNPTRLAVDRRPCHTACTTLGKSFPLSSVWVERRTASL